MKKGFKITRLKQHREQLGYTYHKLGLECFGEGSYGIAIKAWESGEKSATVPTIKRLADFFEIQPEDLINKTGE